MDCSDEPLMGTVRESNIASYSGLKKVGFKEVERIRGYYGDGETGIRLRLERF